MKQKSRENLLGVYDLILSFGAIISGLLMINSSYGVFVEYPKEWLSKAPFDNWTILGIIAITIFGVGNIISAIFSFRRENYKAWIMSAVMGLISFICVAAQVIAFGEWYMATVQFFILSIIQLLLCGYVFSANRKIQAI